MRVRVFYVRYGKNYRGTIEWDGKQFIPSNNSDELKMVITDPIYVELDSGGFGTIEPKADPEQFMRKLYLQYKSYALRVSEPID
jgi:hypothetical protein